MSSFQTGLSGLNASSRNLDVIGNNIANANTIGMKSSRTEFSELVASSMGTGGGGGAGFGVSVATVSQQFSQGNINATGNTLDVAVNGSGFFQLTMPDGSSAYTRDGQFKMDNEGNIKTNSGGSVMGYPTDINGVKTSSTLQPLQVTTTAPIAANLTTSITAEFNLDARATPAAGVVASGTGSTAVAAVAATPRSTYGTNLTVYDAQGVPTPVSLYFEKTATADTWDVYSGLDSTTKLTTITFDSSGKITAPVATSPKTGFSFEIPTGTIDSSNPNTTSKKLEQVITVNLDTVTEFGSAFAVSNLAQDGYASGEFTGMSIGSDGVVTASYSNGQSQAAGQIAMADFHNAQGLTPTGGGNWTSTFASGQPVQGSPGTGKFGFLKSGALEESNVDLTAELVGMMVAQRAYQANAQTIKTQDQVMTTLVNMR